MEKWLNKMVKYEVTGCVGMCTAVAYYRTGLIRLQINLTIQLDDRVNGGLTKKTQ